VLSVYADDRRRYPRYFPLKVGIFFLNSFIDRKRDSEYTEVENISLVVRENKEKIFNQCASWEGMPRVGSALSFLGLLVVLLALSTLCAIAVADRASL
jgi:hypothetical protein